MKPVILKCKPGDSFHFGQAAIEDNMALSETANWMHSDTLFSSIINVLATARPDATDLLVNDFIGHRIRISSLFYCLQIGEKTIYFLPKPCVTEIATVDTFKKLKKIQFVSLEVWKEGINPAEWMKPEDNKYIILQDKFLCKKEELQGIIDAEDICLYHIHSSPKVKVHTLPEDTDRLYYFTQLQIANNKAIEAKNKGLTIQAHFYFLYQCNDHFENKDLFTLAVNLLPQSGIGAKRSSGNGFFEKSEFTDDTVFKDIDEDTHHVSLSLSIPDKDEQQHYLYYQLCTRGGRTLSANEAKGFKATNDNRTQLKRVNMVKEGAVLAKNNVKGTNADISPEPDTEDDGYQKYYRLGTLLSLPVKIPTELL